MNRRSTREPLLRALAAALRDAVRVGDAAAVEDDLGVVVEIRVVQEARRADDLEPGCVRLDEEQRLLAFDEGEHDVEARGRPRS